MITESRAPAVAVRLLTAPVTARTWRATIYATLSAPIGIVSTVVLWVLVAFGLCTIFVLLIGALVFWVALLAAHLLAQIEASRTRALLGQDLQVRRFSASGGGLRQIWSRLATSSVSPRPRSSTSRS